MLPCGQTQALGTTACRFAIQYQAGISRLGTGENNPVPGFHIYTEFPLNIGPDVYFLFRDQVTRLAKFEPMGNTGSQHQGEWRTAIKITINTHRHPCRPGGQNQLAVIWFQSENFRPQCCSRHKICCQPGRLMPCKRQFDNPPALDNLGQLRCHSHILPIYRNCRTGRHAFQVDRCPRRPQQEIEFLVCAKTTDIQFDHLGKVAVRFYGQCL